MALKSIISFVNLLLVLITSIPPSSSLISHHEECLSLFQFKQTILHQDYTTTSFNGAFQKLDSWRKTTISNTSANVFDCCSWPGVVCSRNGHVIELDLSQSSIYGFLTSNSTLFNLVHLQKLNLSGNDFGESQIPSEIARLKQLKSLDLFYSGFSGQIPNEISHLTRRTPSQVDISSSVPHFLANFSSLTSIGFRDCHLQGKFPVTILQLPKLKRLSLARNTDLTGSLPEFRNNSLLEYLNLYATGFFGIVPDSISNLNHLVTLDLDYSFFSGNIPSSVSNLTQLTILSLSQNNFTGPVPSLSSLLKLTNLDLSGNNFIGTIPSLATLSKLTILDLSENNFKKESEYGWIGKLTNLKELYLDDMNIYQEILPFLANLTKLDVASMSENFIPGSIPSSFMNLTQLTEIHFQYNRLDGPIPTTFSNFKRLKTLYLSDNKFIGSVDLDMFLGLKKLKVLYLSGISFVTTGNYTDGTLPQLEELGLSSCGLKEFPSFLFFQKEMIVLQLDNNQIGGLIPVSFIKNNQETLFFIDLSHNRFTGEIPLLICQAESLQLLDLSSNRLVGPLPTCIFGKSMLFINLSQNKFGCTILNTIAHECRMTMLDLSDNQFVGRLPKSFANCTNLKCLDVSHNSFDGVFPYWLGSLTELQVLILSFNRFSGAIHYPPTFSSVFPKLQMLILSNNGFSGHLPDNYFKIWKTMKSATVGFETSISPFFPNETPLTYKGDKPPKILNMYARIDLSYNSFDGEIPQSLTKLQGLGLLDLSNNRLTGHVLPSLGNLKNLESLDLSHNKLSGKIPQELLQLNFLSTFNVSFNYLEGRVPTGNQFNTFENDSYMGNPLLCGKPLSDDCQGSTTSTHPHTSDEYYESLLPSNIIDWIVVFTGFGSGLVIGVLLGNFVYGKYRDWFIEQIGMRKDTWVRPLRNKRRN